MSDTVEVTSDPSLPTVWGGPNEILNCDIQEVTLTAQVTSGIGPYEFEWTDSTGNIISMTADLVVTGPGTYFVQVNDIGANCESGLDAVEVIDISNSPSATIYATPSSILSCVVQSVMLSTDNEPDVVYTWVLGGNNYTSPTLEVDQSATVTLIAFDTVTQCETSQVIEVLDDEQYPVIVVDPYPVLNCLRPLVVIDASNSIASDQASFVWTNSQGDTLSSIPVLNVTAAGTYYIELFDGENGCTSFDTVEVESNFDYPSIDSPDEMTLPCNETTGSIEVVITGPVSAYDINWETNGGTITSGNGTDAISFMGTGQYIVFVQDTNSGCISSDTTNVRSPDGPNAIIATATPTSCTTVDDGIIEVDTVIGGTAPYSIYLDGILMDGTTIINLVPGAYEISVVRHQRVQS